jgi:putative ATPase
MPEEIKGEKLFEPGNNKKEKELKELLKHMWANYYEY